MGRGGSHHLVNHIWCQSQWADRPLLTVSGCLLWANRAYLRLLGVYRGHCKNLALVMQILSFK